MCVRVCLVYAIFFNPSGTSIECTIKLASGSDNCTTQEVECLIGFIINNNLQMQYISAGKTSVRVILP